MEWSCSIGWDATIKRCLRKAQVWENLYAILREKMRQKFVISIIVVENKYKVKNLLIENSKGNH